MNEAEGHLLTVFSAALDCASEQERSAYLDEVCGDDLALRGRVEALLAAHRQAGRFLEQPEEARPTVEFVSPAEAVVSPGPVAGDLLAGRYQLLESIGEGGMGSVWLAEQNEPVKRLVAVKLIRVGMDSKQVLARFEAERQALAMMDHP